MVNYPTILGLPQEDIDRQLYVGVLGLESRVKALENKPKPTPTQSGTVTVTCQEEYEGETYPLDSARAILLSENATPSPTNTIALGITDENGTTLLYEFDEQMHPTQTVKQVPYGDYYLYAQDNAQTLSYSGALTVDGDEEVTITLTGGGVNEITLTITDGENVLEDAEVTLKQNNVEVDSGTADMNGEVIFEVADGTYDVEVTFLSSPKICSPSSISVDSTHTTFTITVTMGE